MKLFIVISFFALAILTYVVLTSINLNIRAVAIGIALLVAYAIGFYESRTQATEALKNAINSDVAVSSVESNGD